MRSPLTAYALYSVCFQYHRKKTTRTVFLLTVYFLSSRNNLQEVPIDNAELVLFIDGSYLKDDQGHYRAGNVIMSTVNIIKGFYLPETKSAQQAELIILS